MGGWPAALRVVAVTVACAGLRTEAGQNSSEILAQSLRRQLIKDNYDYMSADSEDAESRPRIERIRSSGDARGDRVIKTTVLNGERRRKRPVHKVSGRAKEKHVTEKRKPKVNLSQRLMRRRQKIEKHTNGANDDGARKYSSMYSRNVLYDDKSVAEHSAEQTSTVKYKILKVRGASRRSGGAGALVQEQSPHGLAIVKLGAGPFPQFRLPAPRRQYMRARAPLPALGDHDELPPLPLPDAHDATRQPQSYFNNGEDSLNITTIPDEIFVL